VIALLLFVTAWHSFFVIDDCHRMYLFDVLVVLGFRFLGSEVLLRNPVEGLAVVPEVWASPECQLFNC